MPGWLFAEMANPVQQGLKLLPQFPPWFLQDAEMANPVQQGLKRQGKQILARPAMRRNG